MRSRKSLDIPISRRVFLRGAGTVAIGLPLAASVERYGLAQTAVIPDRYVTMYYGNGLPSAFSASGYTGAIAPLAPWADRMAMLRGVRVPIAAPSGELHWRATARYGVGYTPNTNTGAIDQSLDNAIHQAFDPGSKLLNATMHGRAEGNPASRWMHSWIKSKIPNPVHRTPYELFDAIFGRPVVVSTDAAPDEVRAARHHNSVLDSVIEQYQHIKSERSGYSAQTRSMIGDHLDLVRTIERRAMAGGSGTPTSAFCEDEPPDAPPVRLEPIQFCTETACPLDKPILYGDDDTANWNEVWPLFADLYAIALRCGSTRFGTIGCTASGDRYPIPELVASGVTDSPHVLAHEWVRATENGFDQCVNWLMQKIAYFVAALDDPAWPDPNGNTVLDNTLLMIGTELGTGGDGQHRVDSLTYWLAGAKDFIRPGDYQVDATDVDLYSSITRAMGVADVFGNPTDFHDYVDVFTV